MAAWVLITMYIIFTIIKKTIGLRVSEKEELDGLDIHEHGLTSAYAGFAISDPTYAELDVNENTDQGHAGSPSARRAGFRHAQGFHHRAACQV